MGCGDSKASDGTGNYNEQDDELAHELGQRNGGAIQKSQTKKENDDGLFVEATDEQAEQFMAVKPWLGAIVAPSNPPQVIMDSPTQNIELEYANGYRSEDSRQNIFFTNEPNQIVFMTAAIGVVLDITSNKQSFFGAGKIETANGHNDDIECLHVNSSKTLCATGQRGKNPTLFVWNIQTKKVVFKCSQGIDTRAVKLIRFSKDDKYLFTADLHNDHNVHCFEIATQQKVSQAKTGGEAVLDMDTSSGNFALAIALEKGCKFVQFDKFLTVKQGLFGSTERDAQTAIAFVNASTSISGSPKGNFYIWNGNQANKCFKAHQGGINAITVKNDLIYSSGNTDKLLKVFDQQYQEKASFNLTSSARAIDVSNDQIIVGTKGGQIWRFYEKGGQAELVMNGHATGETWGLALDNKGNVVSTGDDNKILCFDSKVNKVTSEGVINEKPGTKNKILGASTLSLLPPNQHARGVDINQQNGHVAVGTNFGEISIREGISNLNQTIFYKKISKEWIEVVKYSPCQKYLAVGSHDNHIYILNVANNYQQISKLTKHNSFITSLDWSEDSKYIQSVCGAYEYLFFDVQSGVQQTGGATALKNEQWATFSCKLGWPVQGVFPPCTDGSHVNGVDRSTSKSIFAVGDDWGLVNLYRNPNVKGSKANSYRAHSSHVVRVKFDQQDQYVYSVGGYDRTLMKWKLK